MNSLGTSFHDLAELELPPEQWLMDSVMPGGCTLLGGTIKKGKSTLMEWLACELAEEMHVSYFALEYNQRMLAKRMQALRDIGYCPRFIRFWHKQDLYDSGLKPLEFYRRCVNEFQSSVVFLDTLAMVKPKTAGSYDAEYQATQMVRDVTADRHVIMAHHTRKSNAETETDPRESFLGSQGIAAVPDNLVLYDRPNGTTRIRGYGRLIDDFETYLTFEDGRFLVEDPREAEIAMLKRQAPSEAKVYLVLCERPMAFTELHGNVTKGEPVDMQMSRSQLANILSALASKNLVRKPDRKGGTYEVTAPSDQV